MFKTVVVPIDGSALSRLALPVAAAIAAAGHAGLRLVGIAGEDSELEPRRDDLREASRSVPTMASAELDVMLDPDPVSTLLDIANDADNVLCFGSHDHTHPVAALLGSVGSKVAERTAHPFVIVGPIGTPAGTGKELVVALDGGDDPEPLLATAVGWALHLDAPLRIVTVYEPVPADIREPEHYTRGHGPSTDPDLYLDRMRDRVVDQNLAAVTTAAIPDPVGVADGLARHLAEYPAILVVVGAGRRHGWASSVTRELLRQSPQPVLVVPHHDSS
jgi:nucleotide-binding universal stress UspA family protein